MANTGIISGNETLAKSNSSDSFDWCDPVPDMQIVMVSRDKEFIDINKVFLRCLDSGVQAY